MIRKLLLALMALCLIAVASATERQPNEDYRARRVALAKAISADNATLILFAPTEAEGPNDLYGFRQDDNFYYLTGYSEPGAAIVINSNPYSEILFLPAHNVTQEKWTGPKLGPDDPQATSITGFDRVANLDTLYAEVGKLLAAGRPA